MIDFLRIEGNEGGAQGILKKAEFPPRKHPREKSYGKINLHL